MGEPVQTIAPLPNATGPVWCVASLRDATREATTHYDPLSFPVEKAG